MSKKIPIFILAAALVVIDQIIKFLVRTLIPLGGKVTVIPGLFGLTFVQNTGAAFSIFSGGAALLAVFSLVMVVLMAVAICKNWLRHPAGQWILAVIMAGAFGNFIDRAFLGYVTDMIDTLFMNFAVYNFADICVVLGAIAMAVYIIFFYDKLEGKKAPKAEKEVQDAPADADC